MDFWEKYIQGHQLLSNVFTPVKLMLNEFVVRSFTQNTRWEGVVVRGFETNDGNTVQEIYRGHPQSIWYYFVLKFNTVYTIPTEHQNLPVSVFVCLKSDSLANDHAPLPTKKKGQTMNTWVHKTYLQIDLLALQHCRPAVSLSAKEAVHPTDN